MNCRGCSLSLLFSALITLNGFTKEIPMVEPDKVGMDAEKLTKVDAKMESLVQSKRLAGAVVLVARKGKIALFNAYGKMDLENDKPMSKDTIFRIYSMTKAITSVAALQLVDQKKLDLDAPISKYLPELKDMKVASKDGSSTPKREMTARDLFRHTSGLSYGNSGNAESDKAFRQQNPLGAKTLAEMVKKLSKVPLAFSPGTDWQYGVSTDVLGRVVEVISGETLNDYFKKHIIDPLNMKDTGFSVPKEKLDRFAANYTSNGKGKLTLLDDPKTSKYAKEVTFYSGGGGLVSTARDYYRFLQMVQNGGELQGKRILSKESITLMRTNQVPKEVGWIKFGAQVRKGVGFGLGFCVRDQMSRWDPQGRLGEYGWGGAASTHYWISPKDELIVVTLEQVMPYSFMTEFAIKGLIYDALK